MSAPTVHEFTSLCSISRCLCTF